ncbi:peroxidasin-like [Spodoptera litura]|uniref:Peroxidasin-like n=1 Tax=Spodoptera litura TaxID=69820 RepID=A0A9J7IY73_SPOLT|nr:peroxidasin-like [Spodoptera litura]
MRSAIIFVMLFLACLAWLITCDQALSGKADERRARLIGIQGQELTEKRLHGNQTGTELGRRGVTNISYPGKEGMQVIELRAMRNREARIPCSNSKIVLDGPGAKVIWLKNDTEIKYKFPNADYEEGWANPENIFETTCNPGSCRDPTNLIIKKVSDQDGGLYRCRVHYVTKQATDHLIELRVVDPPDTPTIFVDAQEFRRITVGPLTIGSSINITCSVQRKDTDTEVYWRRNGAIMNSLQVITTYNVVQAELFLENLTRNDDKTRLECLIQTADVSEAVIRPLVVRMILPPLSVYIKLDGNRKFEVGIPRVVECLVMGSFPVPIIHWTLGASLLTATDYVIFNDGNTTSSTLTLSVVQTDKEKLLTCRAHNMLIPTEQFEDKVNITVGFAPICEIRRVVPVGVIKKEPETVTCTVRADPEPFHFTWVYSDGRTAITKGTVLSENRYSSNLTWLPRDGDFGILECKASNSFGIQSIPCFYNVIPGGPPVPPECEIKSTEASQLDVNCRLEKKKKTIPSDPGWMPYVKVISGMLIIAAAVAVIGLGTQICYVKRDEESEPDLVPRHNECFHPEPDIEMENISVEAPNTPFCSPVVPTSRVIIGGPISPAEEECEEDEDDDSQRSFFV